MNRWIATACLLVTACGGSRNEPATESPPRAVDGTYQFSAGTPNQVIRGTIRVAGGQLGLQYETACQPEVGVRPIPRGMPSSTSVSRYYCGGAWLTFDNRNPAVAKWYATIAIPRQRQVCTRYEMRNGQQVCVSQGSETYYVNETRSGGIQVVKVTP